MKKSFTLIEILLSIFILAILVITSIKAFSHLKLISQKDTMRYLALDKIDNEMNRLVYAFDNLEMDHFRRYDYSFNDTIIETFQIQTSTKTPSGATEQTRYNVYNNNPLNDNFGLLIDSKLNLIELKNKNGTINSVDEGDIVAFLGFRSQDYTASTQEGTSKAFSNISLSLTYPYVVKVNGSNFKYEQLWNNVETVNLKTITQRR